MAEDARRGGSRRELTGTSATADRPQRSAGEAFAPRATDLDRGLTAAEVEDRRNRGLSNDVPRTHTRTGGEIVRANVLTRFNLVLGSLLAIILVVGPYQDALFGLVLVSNTLIGVVQELRAKRTLDRLTLVMAPTARVLRDGVMVSVPVQDLVQDDIVVIGPGNQLAVDGQIVAANVLEMDESVVTGESEPVTKRAGDTLLSGSFVIAGTARYRATRVGREAYAARLASEARRFSLAHSELRAGIDWFLRLVTWLLVPTAGLLAWSQLRAGGGIADALRGAVAGTVAMVPEGLVLLTSIAFAVSVVRLGRRQVLVQELPAVETLARVDVVAFDKTGTITSGLAVESLEELAERNDVVEALGALAGADPSPNATLQVIAAAYPPPEGWEGKVAVPFSSARKWSAVDFGSRGVWVLGAPEVLLADDASRGDLLARVEGVAGSGRRVVLLGKTDAVPGTERPPRICPHALVVLSERIRDDAAETLRYFRDQHVTTKIVSGDHPATVAALAARAGMASEPGPVDARDLPDTPHDLDPSTEAASVFGRVMPAQKRTLVQALQAHGHVVAMVGDGVNDVLALKQADIGIAMGSGTEAARAVAQIVLLEGRFADLPYVVAEGRRVIGNIERVARLFLTKTVYATVMTVVVGVLGVTFPFLPRHLTLIGSLTIGIPAFFLALEPETGRARPHFLRRVLAFAVPAGLVAAAVTLTVYLAATGGGATLGDARTAATLTLAGSGLVVLHALARPMNPRRRWILAGMAIGLAAVLAVPWLRTFFALTIPPLRVGILVLGGVGVFALIASLAPRSQGALTGETDFQGV